MSYSILTFKNKNELIVFNFHDNNFINNQNKNKLNCSISLYKMFNFATDYLLVNKIYFYFDYFYNNYVFKNNKRTKKLKKHLRKLLKHNNPIKDIYFKEIDIFEEYLKKLDFLDKTKYSEDEFYVENFYSNKFKKINVLNYDLINSNTNTLF